MSQLDIILSALRSAGSKVNKTTNGYECNCPAHDDKDPSLSVSTGDDNCVLLNCHAGCTAKEIVSALGMKMADLFDPSAGNQSQRQSTPRTRSKPTKPMESKPKPKYDSAEAAIEACEGQLVHKHSKRWPYHNAAGDVVGYVVRWDKPNGGKTYRPIALTDGAWCCAGMPSPTPLYSLPELAGALTVYVVEGEKCADAARACGFTATTSAHGSKSAAKADWSPLAGKDVVIVPDRDDAGSAYADNVSRLVQDVGARSVRIINLADHWKDLPKGGDIADALELEGGDADSLRTAVESLATAAEPFKAEGAVGMVRYEPFPLEVLPSPLCAFVAESAASINCDASFVALPLLSGLASAIGNTHVAEIKRGYTVPAILWTAIIGESGTAKSPAMKAALRPLREIQTRLLREHEAEVQAWEPEHQRWERDMAKWRSKGAGVEPPAEPQRPICHRLIVSDTTVEALAPLLKQNPRGLLMEHDELSGWIGSFDRYTSGKGGDAAHWLSMHDGSPLTVDRKTSGSLFVPRASVSVTGGIQPGTLRRKLKKEHIENGLAMRILFAHPPRRVRRYTDAEVSIGATASLAALYERLVALTGNTSEDGELSPRTLPLSDEAKGVWREFVDANGEAQAEHTGAIASVYSKLESAAGRLALIVYLVKSVSVNNVTVNSVTNEIDASSLRSGIQLAQWFAGEAIRVFEYIEEEEDEQEIRTLTEWIGQKGGSVSLRDFTRWKRKYKGRQNAEKAAEKLIQSGYARWDTSDGRGRRVVLLDTGVDGDSVDSDDTSLNTPLAPSRTNSHTDARKAG